MSAGSAPDHSPIFARRGNASLLGLRRMSQHARIWSPERAQDWRRRVGWLVGCNYVPAYAANQIELWSAAMFDPAILARELGDAAAL